MTIFWPPFPPRKKRADAVELDALFRRVTGFDPVMWGPSIVGYGRYHYQYESGREGDFLATGFSPRKANFSIYILPGYADFSDILASLGKFKIGKSCLYFNKLADIDVAILERLISAGLKDLNTRWPLNSS
ncbi:MULTISPECIES: DUF1801 domain-containing protein [Falsihalocynthiibacter]|uniref:DUF1801 domain-containing protein n=1 Tax=Falsihalocynthiibacter TaxID=2854182 RepID=UPI003001C2E0